jgi:hypothetical protein
MATVTKRSITDSCNTTSVRGSSPTLIAHAARRPAIRNSVRARATPDGAAAPTKLRATDAACSSIPFARYSAITRLV